MMVSLIFPFLLQMLGFCCFIQHIVGSGPRVVTFSKNLACTSKKSSWATLTSVATLLLWKSTRFHDKKNTIFTKKTPDYKSKLTQSENGQKMHYNANHCPTHCKPETKKTGDSSNACVCLSRCRSLKLLTDDQVTLQRLTQNRLHCLV